MTGKIIRYVQKRRTREELMNHSSWSTLKLQDSNKIEQNND